MQQIKLIHEFTSCTCQRCIALWMKKSTMTGPRAGGHTHTVTHTRAQLITRPGQHTSEDTTRLRWDEATYESSIGIRSPGARGGSHL
jgi:hypothetical protein